MRHKIWQAAGLALLMTLSSTAGADGLENMERLIGKADSQTRLHKPDTESLGASAAQTLDPDAIRLTPDRAKVLQLKKDAVTVVITNPAHAVAFLDSPRTLILMPRNPGTTSLVILDREGKALLERNIIVTAAQPKYVRIRRICADNARGCAPEAYYYCPDGCYAINPVTSDELPRSIPPLSGVATPAAATASMDNDVDADNMIEEETERPLTADELELLEEEADVPQMAVPPTPVPTQPVAPPAATPVPVPVPQPVERMEGEE